MLANNGKKLKKEGYKDLDDYMKKNKKDMSSLQSSNDLQEGQERYLKLKLSVIDTGVGISDEGLKKLFIDFSKLDENSKRNQGGTGLGLSICKNIIEQMGGSVDVESKVGHGTQFILKMNCQCLVKEMRNT